MQALWIGVARDAGGDFEAHAWLECQGRILIGSQDVNRYEPLAGFEV